MDCMNDLRLTLHTYSQKYLVHLKHLPRRPQFLFMLLYDQLFSTYKGPFFRKSQKNQKCSKRLQNYFTHLMVKRTFPRDHLYAK